MEKTTACLVQLTKRLVTSNTSLTFKLPLISQFGEATVWNARLCESNLHDSIKDLVHSRGSRRRTRLISQVVHHAFAALVLIIYNSYNDAEEQIRLA